MGKVKILDNSWFRVLLSLFIAYTLLLGVSCIEQLYKNQSICLCREDIWSCLSRQLLSIISLDNIEGYSIATAATLYLIESRERKLKAIDERWQAIENADGKEFSRTRFDALEYLNSRGISLSKLSIQPIGRLDGIVLKNADLRNASLQGISLEGANLENADFTKSFLYFVDFSNANLINAKFTNVTFFGNKDKDGNIKSSIELNNADINGANFRGAKFMNTEMIKAAKNWDKAIYDDTFRAELGLK